jgi:hypothetical protein
MQSMRNLPRMQSMPLTNTQSGGSSMYLYILLICCCCLSSSAAGYWFTKLRARPMLPGYAAGNWWGKSGGIGDPRGRPKQTPAQCKAYAQKRGYLGFGHRTNAHPQAVYRNTCWFYKNPNGAKGWQGNPKDPAHFSGCTNAAKSWGSC